MKNYFKFLLILNFLFLTQICADEYGHLSDEIETSSVDLAEFKSSDSSDDQPVSGERFVAVHIDAVGVREEIDPNLRGLSNIAAKYIPKNYEFIYIVSATREVVAGIRYNLLISVNDENKLPVICDLVILEKPWITTQWGDKYRILEYTNCTNDATNTGNGVPSGSGVTSNSDNINSPELSVNPLFVNKKQEMSADDIKNLEEQIFVQPTKKSLTSTTTESNVETTEAEPEITTEADSTNVTTVSEQLSDSVKDALDNIFMFGTFGDSSLRPKNVDTTNEGKRDEVIEEIIVPKKVVRISTNNEESPLWQNEIVPEKKEVNKLEKKLVPVDDEKMKKTNFLEKKFNVKNSKEEKEVTDGSTDETNDDFADVQKQLDSIQHDIDEILRGALNYEEIIKIEHVPSISTQFENFDDAIKSYFEEAIQEQEQGVPLPLDTQHNNEFVYLEEQKSYDPLFYAPNIEVIVYFDGDQNTQQRVLEDFNLDEVTGVNNEDNDKMESKESVNREEAKDAVTTPSSSDEDQNVQKTEKFSIDDGKTYEAIRQRRSPATSSATINNTEKDYMLSIIRKGLKQLDYVDNDDNKRVIIELYEVKKLIKNPNEIVYIVHLKTGNSHCIEDDPTAIDDEEDINDKINIIECRKNIVRNSTRLCTMEIRATKPSDARVIKSECSPEKQKKLVKRQITGGTQDEDKNQNVPVLGGVKDFNIEENEYVKGLFQNAIVGLNGEDSDSGYKLKRIVKSKKQVVAGSLYTITAEFTKKDVENDIICDFSIWDRPWIKEHGPEIKIKCNDNDKKYVFRQRRSTDDNQSIEVVGGLKRFNLEQDKHVNDLFQNAIVGFNGQDSDTEYKLHRVIKSEKQVVAGSLYKIKAEFTKNNNKDHVVCDFTIWERTWIRDQGPEINVECNDNEKKYKFRQRRSTGEPLVGGPSEFNIEEDEHVKGLFQNAIVGFNGADAQSDYKLNRIIKSNKQVVAGVLYKISAEFTKNNDAEPVICHFEIWERPWMKNEKPQITVKCEGNDTKYKFRAKRSLLYDHRNENLDALNVDSENFESSVLFEKFKTDFNRNYKSSMEQAMRFRIFKNNLIRINQLNRRELGTAEYGVTDFADLTPQEYKLRTGLLERDTNYYDNVIKNPIAVIPENLKIPDSFDWRDKNVVTPVKNQGQCGSCWAFSTTGNIESLNAIKTGVLEEYSEQELLDCDTEDSACNGGLMDNAYKAIEKLGGLELESEYPYEAKKEKECHFNKTLVHVQVKGAVDLPKNETAMAQYLLANGPISIGLNANAMQFYRGGISHPWRPLCRHSQIDHGVLIVGYGVKDYPKFNKTLPYWIVKNSWGPSWGEQGYYRIYRGDNTCGVSEMVSSAVLE